MYYQNGKLLNTLWLSNSQWNNRIKNIFHRNIRTYNQSITISGIAHDLYPCIIESELDTGDILIDVDKYKELYKTAGFTSGIKSKIKI